MFSHTDQGTRSQEGMTPTEEEEAKLVAVLVDRRRRPVGVPTPDAIDGDTSTSTLLASSDRVVQKRDR